MKTKIILISAASVLLSSGAFAQSTGMDRELTDLTEKLAAKIKEKGSKKVAVVDFADLQGASSELGRYIAEQITLDFVVENRTFAVLDRAHRNNILAEHKLTAEGLVDPATAREFGKFAGVDALILGTVVPMSDTVKVTATIVTTDTAEILGGGKAAFQKSKEVQDLLDRSVSGSYGDQGSSGTRSTSTREFEAQNPIQKFGNFTVEVVSFRILPSGNGFAALQLVNTSKQLTIGVAPNSTHNDTAFEYSLVSAKILDENGNLVRCCKIDGLNVPPAFFNYYPPTGMGAILGGAVQNWQNLMTDIKPGESARFTLEFGPRQGHEQDEPRVKLGNVFKLQAELITTTKKGDNDKPSLKLENIFLDKIVPTKPKN